MPSVDIIIENGTVLTVNDRMDVIADGVVGIRGDRLCLVGPRSADTDAIRARRRIDAEGGLILPGLINTHTHLPMTLFRGLADDLPLQQWLEDHIFPAERRHIHPASVAIGTRLACAESIRSGTTTCCDGYFLESNVAEAVRQAGMRAVLGQGVIDAPAPGIADAPRNISHAEEFVRAWSGTDPLVRPAVFCHSPYTCSRETLVRAKALADRYGVLFQIHVAETRTECERLPADRGDSVVGYLARIGVLDPRTLMVHCVWVDDRDIDVMARCGAAVSHNPDSNLKLAAGIAPVPRMIDAGLRVGLGTDGCASNNVLDLFKAMDLTAKLHKVSGSDPTVMGAASVLRMATIDAARTIGWDDAIGSLEVGKQADLIVVDSRQPHLTPVYNPVSHLVYAARGTDVTTSIIAGRVVMERRELTTIDVQSAMEEAKRIALKIKDSVGSLRFPIGRVKCRPL